MTRERGVSWRLTEQCVYLDSDTVTDHWAPTLQRHVPLIAAGHRLPHVRTSIDGHVVVAGTAGTPREPGDATYASHGHERCKRIPGGPAPAMVHVRAQVPDIRLPAGTGRGRALRHGGASVHPPPHLVTQEHELHIGREGGAIKDSLRAPGIGTHVALAPAAWIPARHHGKLPHLACEQVAPAQLTIMVWPRGEPTGHSGVVGWRCVGVVKRGGFFRGSRHHAGKAGGTVSTFTLARGSRGSLLDRACSIAKFVVMPTETTTTDPSGCWESTRRYTATAESTWAEVLMGEGQPDASCST